MDIEFLDHCELPIKILKFLKLWQTIDNTKIYRIWGFFSHLTFVQLYFILPLVYLVKFKVFEGEPMTFVMIYLGLILKSFLIIYHVKSIEGLIRNLKELLDFTAIDTDTQRLKLRSHVKFMVRLFKVFLTSLILAVLPSLAIPFITNRLPYVMWIPFDYNSNKIVFWLTAIFEVINPVVGSAIVTSFDLISVNFLGMAAALLNELSKRIKIMSEGAKVKTDDEKHAELVNCIEVHQHIKTFVNEIENCFSSVLFVQRFLSSTLICLTVYNLSTVRNISDIWNFLWLKAQ